MQMVIFKCKLNEQPNKPSHKSENVTAGQKHITLQEQTDKKQQHKNQQKKKNSKKTNKKKNIIAKQNNSKNKITKTNTQTRDYKTTA